MFRQYTITMIETSHVTDINNHEISYQADKLFYKAMYVKLQLQSVVRI